MIIVNVEQAQIDWAVNFIKEKSIANRGVYDGSENQQIIGKVGECVVSGLFGRPLQEKDGFDNGIDIILNGFSFDIKTKIRHVEIKPWYGWNIPLSQFNNLDYKNDYYMFCGYDERLKKLSVCGFIGKKEMVTRSIFLPVGAYRIKSDGQKFPVINGKVGYPCEALEIVQAALHPINSINDILFNERILCQK
jgi:hypothetical protein